MASSGREENVGSSGSASGMIDVGIIEVASGQGGMIYAKAELGLMMEESDIVSPLLETRCLVTLSALT